MKTPTLLLSALLIVAAGCTQPADNDQPLQAPTEAGPWSWTFKVGPDNAAVLEFELRESQNIVFTTYITEIVGGFHADFPAPCKDIQDARPYYTQFGVNRPAYEDVTCHLGRGAYTVDIRTEGTAEGTITAEAQTS